MAEDLEQKLSGAEDRIASGAHGSESSEVFVMAGVDGDRLHLMSEVAQTVTLLLLCGWSVNVDQPHLVNATTYLLLLIAATPVFASPLHHRHRYQCPSLTRRSYKIATNA